MKDKKQIINSLDKAHYNKKEVVDLLNKCPNIKHSPYDIIVGDIVFHQQLNHPYIIIDITNGIYFGLILTSNSDTYCILDHLNNRFTESYITTTSICEQDVQTKNYRFSVSKKEVKRIKKLYKEYIKELLYVL